MEDKTNYSFLGEHRAFHRVSYLIEDGAKKKIPPTSTLPAYRGQIDITKKRLEKIIGNLEEVLNGKVIHSNMDLFYITRFLGGNFKSQPPQIIKSVIEELNEAIKYSEELKINPAAFYDNKNAVKILQEVYGKLASFYTDTKYRSHESEIEY